MQRPVEAATAQCQIWLQPYFHAAGAARPSQHDTGDQHHDQADRHHAGELPSITIGIAGQQQPAMQLADGGEKLLAPWTAEDARIIRIDIDRGRPRAALVAGKPDAHRRGRITCHRHGRNLAKIVSGLQSRDQPIRRQHRRGAGLDPHDPGIQAGPDLILEAHRRPGYPDQGQHQRKRKANDGMDLQQRGLDRVLAHGEKHVAGIGAGIDEARRNRRLFNGVARTIPKRCSSCYPTGARAVCNSSMLEMYLSLKHHTDTRHDEQC